MATYYVYNGGNGTGGGTSDPTTASNWTNAYVSLGSLQTALGGSLALTNTDTIYVAHDHLNTAYSGSTTLTFSGGPAVLCVDRTSGALVSPTGGTFQGTERTAAAFTLNINGIAWFSGLVFQTGANTSSGSDIVIGSSNSGDHALTFENCVFYTNNTSTGSDITIGGLGTASNQFEVKFVNCQFYFKNTSQNIQHLKGRAYFYNCKLYSISTAPTFMFSVGDGTIFCSSCDWSGPANLVTVDGNDGSGCFLANNCNISTATTGTHPGPGGPYIELHACSGSNNNYDYYKQTQSGVIDEDTSIYLTTGAAGATNNNGSAYSYSLKYTPNSTYVSAGYPMVGPWVYAKNTVTGSSRTFSMEIAYDSAAALTNMNAWLEVEVMGDAATASTPMTYLLSSFPSATNVFRDHRSSASNLSNTSAAWTGTSGWTNKKTATLSKAVTPNQQGYVRARVCVSATTTVYLNPKLTIS